MLPFFIYTQPETARALLLYRYHTLDGARQNAREAGFRGARYAWESADTGVEDDTEVDVGRRPPDLDGRGGDPRHLGRRVRPDGLRRGNRRPRPDDRLRCGNPLRDEPFLGHRLEAMPDGRYVLSRVVGPDEFHEHVDNSAYTNYLVRWHLQQAAHVYAESRGQPCPANWPALSERIGLTREEVEEWLNKAEQIRLPSRNDDGVIEQFDGYFGLETLPVSPRRQRHADVSARAITTTTWPESNLVKQADVVMLTYVLPDEFGDDVKLANYEYYEPLTLHKSSLSPRPTPSWASRSATPAAPSSTSAGRRSSISSTTRATPTRASTSPPPAEPGR